MADQVRISSTDGANAWQQGFSGSGAKYQRGVENVKTAPNAKAAASINRWIASVNDKKVQDKYVSRNNAVTLQQWQSATTQYGVQNLSRGATKGVSKYGAFAAKFYPYLSQGMSKVASMPNTTLQDRIQRAVAMMTHSAGYNG